jgi:DNA polymerase-3 subunit alpha
MELIPLFVESNFQMNGSNIRLEQLVKKAVSERYGSLALTDSRLHGALRFYRLCQKAGIKPILGLQLKIESLVEDTVGKIIAYAKNNEGYLNLLKLASISSYGNVPFEKLCSLQSELIIVILTDQSKLPAITNQKNMDQLILFKSLMNESFNNWYVSLSMDDAINTQIYNTLPTVPIHVVRYLQKEDFEVHKVLKAIFNQPDTSLLNEEQEAYFPTKKELQEIYSLFPQAIKNASDLVDQINLQIEMTPASLPKYPVKQGVTSKDYLRALTIKGLEKRLLKTRKINQKTKYESRLMYELKVINSMGYNDYFLIVWDFVRYAKQQGFLVGPGRGSAAASLVSYCLGITNVDPIEFDLVFERFLNPDRITLPDIDMDLPDDKRDEVILYLRDKYGMSHVASICTFGTFLAKSAIRDVARVLGLSGVLLEQVIKESEEYQNISEMIESSKKIKNIILQHTQAKKVLEIASAIEGLHRHVSTHAAGIILTHQKLTNHTALQPGLLNMHQTQFEAKDLESLGLLKIDLLGLKNLSSIAKVVQLIYQKEKRLIDVYRISLDDKKTFKLLQRVETTGIFQLESKGMRRLLEDFQISSFEDIATCLALFRPGPMENIPLYIKRRKQEEKVIYPHEAVEKILKPTYGIIVYQEQIIQIASDFAGYTYAEADLLRRAVSKKQRDVLQRERVNFIQKAMKLHRDQKSSEIIYDYIVKFANYGFNKAHSVAYAMVSYWMAYLKANYPKYFISVLLTSAFGSVTTLRNYIREGYRLGVQIRMPSINYSTNIFEPDGEYLLFPLLGIKHVGINTVNAIIDERNSKPFSSYVDAVKRLSSSINKRVLEALIFAGAFDEFGYSRKTMIEQLENVIAFSQLGSHIDESEFIVPDLGEYDQEDLLQKEQDVLGFSLFHDPLKPFENYIQKHHLLRPMQINQRYLNETIRFVAKVSSVREIKTKYDKVMAFLDCADRFSDLSCVIFSTNYQMYKQDIVVGDVHLIKGKVEMRNKKIQIVISNIQSLQK